MSIEDEDDREEMWGLEDLMNKIEFDPKVFVEDRSMIQKIRELIDE